jgi:acyl dehydratase
MNASVDFPSELEWTTAPIKAIDLALFAAASGDHNPLHLDAEVASAAGYDRPVVHGMLTMALVARVFTQQFGATSVRNLQTRFVGIAKLGDAIRITAVLTKVEDAVGYYSLRAHTDEGTEVVTGSASVARTTK